MDRQDHLQTIQETRLGILQGDKERVAKQHESGKGTARERVAKLFDAGSFIETDALKADGNVVCGYGTVNERIAYCFAQDFSSQSGAMGEKQAQKILKLLDLAQLTGAPVIALLDSNGAKVLEGVQALASYAQVFAKMTRLSGVCPMISCVMGPCRGVAAMFTQVADISIGVDKECELELHSPLVVGKKLTAADWAAQGGVDLTAQSEEQAFSQIAALLDLLPACNIEDSPMTEGEDLNRTLTQCDPSNGLTLIREIADDGQMIELGASYGKAAHTVLCRVGGRTAGMIATDYSQDNGRLDALACEKIARFVSLCDCYQIEIISLINTDGLSVGRVGEQAWYMRAAAKMLYAYAEATAPKVAVITGSAVGGAYVAMGGAKIADISYAWPDAFVSPLTAEVAVQALCDEQLSAGANREELEANYKKSTDALYTAQNGIVDDIIEPAQTRKQIIAAMEALQSKHDVNLPRKHGNLPL